MASIRWNKKFCKSVKNIEIHFSPSYFSEDVLTKVNKNNYQYLLNDFFRVNEFINLANNQKSSLKMFILGIVGGIIVNIIVSIWFSSASQNIKLPILIMGVLAMLGILYYSIRSWLQVNNDTNKLYGRLNYLEEQLSKVGITLEVKSVEL